MEPEVVMAAFVCTALVSLCMPASAQTIDSARDPAQFAAQVDGAPRLATAGDLSAALAVVDGTRLMLSLSDGRGTVWSDPIEVDPVGSPATVGFYAVEAAGDALWIAWTDNRFAATGGSSWSAFVRRLDLASGALGAEIAVPGVGNWQSAASFAAEPEGGTVHLHWARVESAAGQVPGGNGQRVALTSSRDAGATWGAPLPCSAWSTVTTFALKLLASGSKVHLLWNEGVVTSALEYVSKHQRSSDGGLSLDFVPEKTVDTRLSLEASVEGDLLAIEVLLPTSDVTSVPIRYYLRVSQNGGETFGQPLNPTLPGVPPFSFVYAAIPTILPGSDEILATYLVVTSGLFTEVLNVVRRSLDGGATWMPGYTLPLPAYAALTVIAANDGSDRVVFLTGSPSASSAEAAISYDRGASAQQVVVVNDDANLRVAALGWNSLYQNLLVALGDVEAGQPAYVGGFRPQAFTPAGFAAGSNAIGATLSGFDGDTDFAWLMLSTQSEGLQLPNDGRQLGLGDSPVLQALLPAALGGLGGVVPPSGTLALPGLGIGGAGLPPRLTLYGVALGFDLDLLRITDISDRVTIETGP